MAAPNAPESVIRDALAPHMPDGGEAEAAAAVMAALKRYGWAVVSADNRHRVGGVYG